MEYNTLLEKLGKCNQEHVLKFWDELNPDEKRQLSADIEELNVEELTSYFKRAISSIDVITKLDTSLKPIPDTQIFSCKDATQDKLKDIQDVGLRAISEGQVGVVLLAGGQGTRLGSTNPKGMFDLQLPSRKTFFQIQAERILRLQELAEIKWNKRGEIVWYIMTSEHTFKPTVEFLEANSYFGLQKKNVVIFSQRSIPCFSMDGKLMLDQKCRISRAPDGNGGIYRALKVNGVLDHMDRSGVKYVHVHSVDNILIKVADPIFVGYCVKENADCVNKVVEKVDPDEPVGVIVVVDGRYRVVEYSEITPAVAAERNSAGKLIYRAGNICNHVFKTDFLRTVCTKFDEKLQLHAAKKKIPFVDSTGERVCPKTPNGIKIEKFIFDVFEYAERFFAMEVLRDEEFSALKNGDDCGKDCPSTSRSDLFRLHKRYIRKAGGTVVGDVCEISPLLSYAGEGLEPVVSKKSFTSPVYLRSDNDQ